MNLQQSITEMSLGKNSRFSTLNRWTRIVMLSEEYKKTYLSFRFITSRPLCQIEQGDQTKIK